MRGKFRGKWQSSVSRIIKMLQETEDKHLQIINTFCQAQNCRVVCQSPSSPMLRHTDRVPLK